ncbi:hypothetical protein KFK09_024939 [Dendrobium nobile]|uniref:Uncharacterized protein n=1 Tax=Dendrobium nobile TaxID=94219 RepID=A0A8T3AE05_DENNO|nr:hypothetical protein KFK09_024939 [Dendrobium nobile]
MPLRCFDSPANENSVVQLSLREASVVFFVGPIGIASSERNQPPANEISEIRVISKEAKEYGLGETKYYMVIVSFAVVMQCFFLGRVGVVLYSSALLTGIVVDVLLPVTVVLAVIFFHEPFTSDKAVALVLSIWGFTSYVYGEIKDTRKRKKCAVMVEAIHPALEN